MNIRFLLLLPLNVIVSSIEWFASIIGLFEAAMFIVVKCLACKALFYITIISLFTRLMYFLVPSTVNICVILSYGYQSNIIICIYYLSHWNYSIWNEWIIKPKSPLWPYIPPSTVAFFVNAEHRQRVLHKIFNRSLLCSYPLPIIKRGHALLHAHKGSPTQDMFEWINPTNFNHP